MGHFLAEIKRHIVECAADRGSVGVRACETGSQGDEKGGFGGVGQPGRPGVTGPKKAKPRLGWYAGSNLTLTGRVYRVDHSPDDTPLSRNLREPFLDPKWTQSGHMINDCTHPSGRSGDKRIEKQNQSVQDLDCTPAIGQIST